MRVEAFTQVFGGQAAAEAEVDIAALVHRHATLLFRIAHSVLRNSHEAEDVVQDVFIRVMHHRATLPSLRSERVWLVRIAWNLALDRKRRVQPQSMDNAFAESLAAQLVPADRAVDGADRLRRVLRAMDALPRAERSALLLSAMDEMSNAEIAAVLGKSESAVRALIFRARTRLRERLAAAEQAVNSRKGGAR